MLEKLHGKLMRSKYDVILSVLFFAEFDSESRTPKK